MQTVVYFQGVVECLKIVTRVKSQRIAKFAFDYATKNGRKKVTAVHKANIMKLGDGLFLKSCQDVSSHPQCVLVFFISLSLTLYEHSCVHFFLVADCQVVSKD